MEIDRTMAHLEHFSRSDGKQAQTYLCGFEISGEQGLHIGHHLVLRYLKEKADLGKRAIVLLSGVHAWLNDKPGKIQALFKSDEVQDCDKLVTRKKRMREQIDKIYPGLDVIDYQSHLDSKYFYQLLRLAKNMKTRQVLKSLPDDLREVSAGEGVSPSKFFYVLLQILDPQILGADGVVAGIDQRKIYMRVRDIYPRLGYLVPQMTLFPLLQVRGRKVSKSNMTTNYSLNSEFYRGIEDRDPQYDQLIESLREYDKSCGYEEDSRLRILRELAPLRESS